MQKEFNKQPEVISGARYARGAGRKLLRVMAVADGYAMMRVTGGAPFAISVKDVQVYVKKGIWTSA